MGHSAGCHLVTLLALDPRYLAGVGLRPGVLRGVVAWSGGAYDLVAKVKAGGTYGPYINRRSAIRRPPGATPRRWPTSATPSRCRRFLFVSVVDSGKTDSKLAAEKLAGLIRDAEGPGDDQAARGPDPLDRQCPARRPRRHRPAAILLDFVREATGTCLSPAKAGTIPARHDSVPASERS